MAIEKLARTNARFLVVEDDQATRELITRLLEVMGAAKVWQAKDGSEGLRIACTEKPDLILCDLEMAPVDGLSLLAGLRFSRDFQVSSAKVIFFTSDKDLETMKKARQLGVEGYVSKPFNPPGFSAIIRKAIDGTAANESNTTGASSDNTTADPQGTTPDANRS